MKNVLIIIGATAVLLACLWVVATLLGFVCDVFQYIDKHEYRFKNVKEFLTGYASLIICNPMGMAFRDSTNDTFSKYIDRDRLTILGVIVFGTVYIVGVICRAIYSILILTIIFIIWVDMRALFKK